MFLWCGKECSWSMYAKKLPDEPTVQIRTFVDKHTCSRTFENVSVKPRYIAKKFLDLIRMNPKWHVKCFKEYVAHKLQAQVSISKAYRAFKIAKRILEGSSSEQYEMLWDYCEEMRRSNPGTTVVMKVKQRAGPKGESVFRSVYICWGALKRGFLEGCRPIIGLDGTHLTGPHKGILLTAVAIDPNNCMYPFAYAVVGVENYKTWKWFIKLLAKDLQIDGPEDYTFMSDKQKGLIKAMEKILPGVEHRFCVWHLYNNFKLLHKGIALKNLLWKAARSTTKPHFLAALEELKVLDPLAYEWLSSKPGENWSKSHFSTHAKCDLLLNNLCESFNSAIKEPRGKAIISMLEGIRVYLMDLNMKKKLAIERVEGVSTLCPKIHKKLDLKMQRSHDWIPTWNGLNQFEVRGMAGDIISLDLKEMTCACRSWQLSGIPCPHAIACLNFMGHNPEASVHLCYTKEVYKKCYANVMMPMNGRELWKKTANVKLLPPVVRVQPGRPKTARRRGPDEKQVSHATKVPRTGIIMKCKKCRKVGHNARTCGRPERRERPAKKSKTEKVAQHLVDETDSESETGDEYLFRKTKKSEVLPSGGFDNMCEVEVQVEQNDERDDLEQNDERDAQVTVDQVCEALNEPVEQDDEALNEADGGVDADDEEDVVDDVGDDIWDQIWRIDDDLNQTQASELTQAPTQDDFNVERDSEERDSSEKGSPERLPKRKQGTRRSARLMFSPNKSVATVVSHIDLTVEKEGKCKGTMHGGTVKARHQQNKMEKGQFYKKGKLYVTKEALNAAMRHEKKQAKKK